MLANRWLPLLMAAGLFFGMLIACGAPTELAPATKAPQTHETVRVDILAAPKVVSGYVLSFAMSDFVNKSHPWLRLTPIETTGTGENIATMSQQPDRRKNSLIYSEPMIHHTAMVGDPPFKTPYTTLRAVARTTTGADFIVTLNKDIRKMEDLVNRKVALGFPLSTNDYSWRLPMRHSYGIEDKIVIQNIGWDKGAAALADGMVDACVQMVEYGSDSSKPVPMPSLQQLISTKQVYFVELDKEAVTKAAKQSGYPLFAEVLPISSLGSNIPPQPLVAGGIAPGWWADSEMDEGVVYEICKQIYENIDKFAGYHPLGKGLMRDRLGLFPISKDMYHPGAVKFYQEKGIKMGME